MRVGNAQGEVGGLMPYSVVNSVQLELFTHNFLSAHDFNGCGELLGQVCDDLLLSLFAEVVSNGVLRAGRFRHALKPLVHILDIVLELFDIGCLKLRDGLL